MSRTLMTRWLIPEGVSASAGAAGTTGDVPSAILMLHDFRQRCATAVDNRKLPPASPAGRSQIVLPGIRKRRRRSALCRRTAAEDDRPRGLEPFTNLSDA